MSIEVNNNVVDKAYSEFSPVLPSPETMRKLTLLREKAEGLRKQYGTLRHKPSLVQAASTYFSEQMQNKFGINTPIWIFFPGERWIGAVVDRLEALVGIDGNSEHGLDTILQITTNSETLEDKSFRIWNTTSFPGMTTTWDITYIELNSAPPCRIMLPSNVAESRVEVLGEGSWNDYSSESNVKIATLMPQDYENLNMFDEALDQFQEIPQAL